MNEEEKFDELLRSKLSEREFPFDEVNWDEAERLIITQERWRKISRISLIFFAGLVAGVVIMLPFMPNPRNAAPGIVVSKSNTIQSPVSPGNSSLPANQSPVNTTEYTTKRQVASSPPVISAISPKNSSTLMRTASLPPSNTAKAPEKHPALLAKVEKENPQFQHPENENLTVAAAEENKVPDQKQPESKKQGTNTNPPQASNNSIAETNSINKITPINTNAPVATTTNTNTTAAATNNSNAITTVTTTTNPSNSAGKSATLTTNTTSTNITNSGKTDVVNTAPLKNSNVTANTKKDSGSADNEPISRNLISYKDSVNYSTNIFSVYAGGNYSLGWTTNGAKEANGITPLIGLDYTHCFNSKIATSIGVGYSELARLDNSYTSSSVQYDFGANSQITSVTPETIYYLSFPLDFQYNVDSKDRVSLGFDYLIMLTTSGAITSYEQNAFGQETVLSSEIKNGYTQGISNYDFQFILSYTRMLTNRLGISPELYLGFISIENSSFPGINTDEKNRGFRLILSYQLMK